MPCSPKRSRASWSSAVLSGAPPTAWTSIRRRSLPRCRKPCTHCSLHALTVSPRPIGTCSRRRRWSAGGLTPIWSLWLVTRAEPPQASFAAMEAFDLIRRVEGSSDYVFKHALVRDALYNGLLSGPRAALHLRVAEELELRGGNRLMEIAETLAHHFSETRRVDRAFAYLAMAGDKSLDIYALQEAEENYRHALKIFDDHNACASSDAVAAVVLRLLEAFVLQSDYRDFGHVTEKYLPLIRKGGDSPDLVKALYYQGLFASYSLVDYHASHRLMAGDGALVEFRSVVDAVRCAIEVQNAIRHGLFRWSRYLEGRDSCLRSGP